MDPIIISIIAGVVALVAGILAGKAIFAKDTRRQVEEAEQQARKTVADAQLVAENLKKEKLLEALEELHNGGSPMTTNIARKVIEAFEKKNQPPEELNTLTNKEKQILDLLAKGFLYKEIAIQLHSTRNTVKQHIHHIYEKLHVQNRTEALNKAFPRR